MTTDRVPGRRGFLSRATKASLVALGFPNSLLAGPGAWLTDTGAVPAGAVDPRTVGARGDGVADDSEALIRAATAAGRGGVVWLSAGRRFRVTRKLGAIADWQTWTGGGELLADAGFTFNMFDLSGRRGVKLSGLVATSGPPGASMANGTATFILFGPGASDCHAMDIRTTGFRRQLQFIGCTGCSAINCRSDSAYGWGVSIQANATDCLLEKITIAGVIGEHGLYVAGRSLVEPVRGLRVNGLNIRGSRYAGLKLSFAQDCGLRDIESTANGEEGVVITNSVYRCTLSDVVTSGNGGNGLLLSNAPRQIVDISRSTPCEVTVRDDHHLYSGERVVLCGLAGMPMLDGRDFEIRVLDARRFGLVGSDTRSVPPYAGGAFAATLVVDNVVSRLYSNANGRNGVALNTAVRHSSLQDLDVYGNGLGRTREAFGLTLSGASTQDNEIRGLRIHQQSIGVQVAGDVGPGNALTEFDCADCVEAVQDPAARLLRNPT